MKLFVTLLIGYSIVASAILYIAYVGFLHNLNKSPRALISCALLLLGLSALQLGHLEYVTTQADLLESKSYLISLFLVPGLFYIFSRSVLFDETTFSPWLLPHLLPVLLPYILRIEVALSVLFCIGAGYSLWLTHVIYKSSSIRKRSRFELFFFALFSLLALGVLLLGLSFSYIDQAFFYYFYAFSISFAMVLVVGVLLSFPSLLSDIAEAAKASYATSTLTGIDVELKKAELRRLMEDERLYQQEDLSLTSLAEVVNLNGHQLSELINSEFSMSFSKFVRKYRVEEAKVLLKAEPDASILSISMQVGFRSQSNFYAAFKEVTGKSPSYYRP